MPSPRLRVPLVAAALLAALVLVACRSSEARPPQGVTGHLAGTITVQADVDSVGDFSDFRVLVARVEGAQVDTLGHAVTDAEGRFATDVTAPARGVYSLFVARAGELLATSEYVVADGDSARLRLQLPTRRTRLPVRSYENAAWQSFRTTMALHKQGMRDDLQRLMDDAGALDRGIRQTVTLLWDLRETYPGTLGAASAEAEAIALLDGFDDAQAVTYARAIAPDHPQYVRIAQIARRAQARTEGQAAALELLRTFGAAAPDDATRAALQAEVVRTHLDSLAAEEALAAARTLRTRYPDTGWGEWARRAAYEVEHLLPGREAPAFAVVTVEGDTLALADLRGRPVVLEFYRPGDRAFERQLSTRRALYDATRPLDLALVSVSLEPDTLLNEAFFEGRDLPGTHVIAPGGLDDDLVRTYNLGAVPTRFLLDRDGRIVGKYPGAAYAALQRDVEPMLAEGP
jgi:peroxiredoxin